MRRPLFFPAYHTGARRATLTLPGAYAKMMNTMNGKSTPITRSQRGARTLRGGWPAGRNVRPGARREEMPARRHRVTVRRARNESGTAKDFASHAGRHGGAFFIANTSQRSLNMKLYNTMSMQKEEFVPIEPGKVRMYACGRRCITTSTSAMRARSSCSTCCAAIWSTAATR